MTQFYVPLSKISPSELILDAMYVVESPDFKADYKLYVSIRRADREQRFAVRIDYTEDTPRTGHMLSDSIEVYPGDTFRHICFEDNESATRTFVDIMIFPDGRKLKLEAVKTEPMP